AQHERITVSASVDDANGQSVSASKNIDLYAGKVLVGLESRQYMMEAKKPANLTVVTVKPDDTIAANTPVRVVTKQTWWRSIPRGGPGGGYFWTSEKIESGEVERCKGKTDSAGRFACQVTPDNGGSLQIIAETTEGKRTLRAATWSWIYGDPEYWGGGADQ